MQRQKPPLPLSTYSRSAEVDPEATTALTGSGHSNDILRPPSVKRDISTCLRSNGRDAALLEGVVAYTATHLTDSSSGARFVRYELAGCPSSA